jgi:tetratricopeptide (TPR) repeat protein
MRSSFLIFFLSLFALPAFSDYNEFSPSANDALYNISQFKYKSFEELVNTMGVDTSGNEGFYLISYYYIAHNKVEKAQEYLYKANRKKDFPGFSNFLMGRIEYAKENYTLAYEYFIKSLNWQQNFELAVIGVVTSLISSENIKEAESAVSKYIKSHNESGEAIYFKGLILLKKGKYEKALEYFNQILNMKTYINRSDAYASRGNAELDNNLLEDAERSFDTALAINKNSALAWHGKGLATFRMSNFEEALVAFKHEEMILHNNTSKSSYLKEAYYNLGMTYLRLNDPKNACMNFHKSCKMKNENACYMVVTKCSKSSGSANQ